MTSVLGVPAAPVLNVAEALQHPHTVHREMVVEHEGYKAVASPIKLSRTPATFRHKPPALNQDSPEMRKALLD